MDKEEYADEANPHGVGAFFGKIVDPFGPEVGVQWADGGEDTEPMKKKYLAVALQPSKKFVYFRKTYVCVKYSAKGCHCLPVAKRKYASPKRKPKRKPASPKRKAAAAIQPAVTKKPAEAEHWIQVSADSPPSREMVMKHHNLNKAAAIQQNAKLIHDLELQATLAATAKAAPDTESIDTAHARIATGMAAEAQLQELRALQAQKSTSRAPPVAAAAVITEGNETTSQTVGLTNISVV